MILNQNDTVFFIIDVQEKLANAVFNKQELLIHRRQNGIQTFIE